MNLFSIVSEGLNPNSEFNCFRTWNNLKRNSYLVTSNTRYPNNFFSMIRFTALFLLVFNSIQLNAQVQILAEQDQERNLTLFALNDHKIPYTIQIQFQELKNLESLEGELIYKVAKPGKSTLVKLQSIYGNENIGFRYNTKLYKGDFQQSLPSENPYLIPLGPGSKTTMRPLTVSYSPNTKSEKNQPYTGVLFLFRESKNVTAPRKGIVSELKMDSEKVSEGPSDFASENYIEIYHQDGTFTRLSGLKANSAQVEIGDLVIPGQVIASPSTYPNSDLYQVKMIQSRWEMDIKGVLWINYPVKIYTEKGSIASDQVEEEITVLHPTDLITLEMDKKELKKYLGK